MGTNISQQIQSDENKTEVCICATSTYLLKYEWLFSQFYYNMNFKDDFTFLKSFDGENSNLKILGSNKTGVANKV